MKKLSMAAALAGLFLAGGIALAQTNGYSIPGLFIASPIGTEQINVVNAGPQIATVTLRQLRDASGYQVFTQATTQTVQVNAGTSVIEFTGTTAATSATLNLPVAPVDGQRVEIFSQAGITTLTIAATTGQTVSNAATTLAANGSTEMLYQLSAKIWYRIQ
jgi:hypothetical protein